MRKSRVNHGALDLRDLYARCSRSLLNTAYRMLWNQADAEEVLQEAFLRLHNRQKRESVKSPEAFLRRVVVNLCIDRLRRKRPDLSLDESTDDLTHHESHADPDALRGDQVLDEKERARLIQEAIDTLPPNERAAFTLREYDGLSYEEIAATVDATTAQVRSWLYRGRQKLIRKLQPLWGPDEGGEAS